MSEEVTLGEFARKIDENDQSQNWREVKLDQVAYKRSENVDPQEGELKKHIGLEHIEPNNPTPEWEAPEDLSSTKRRFEAGDILFAKLRPNLEKAAQPEFDGVASTDIFPIVAAQGINSKYLLYRLSSKSAFDYARRTSAGTRMPRTSWNLFSNFNFDLPPLLEQRKIATILYVLDQMIDQTEEIIDQTHRVKDGIIQDIFSNGYYDHELHRTEYIGAREIRFPADWSVEPLGHFTDKITKGKTPSSYGYSYKESGINFVRVEAIDSSGKFLEKEFKHISEEAHKHLSGSELKSDDVLLSIAGVGLGQVAIVDESILPANTNQALSLIRLSGKNEILPKYLEIYLKSNIVQKHISSITTQSAQPNINLKQVSQIPVLVPKEDEQKNIIDSVNQMEEYSKYEKEVHENLQRLKRGLMQDLLSGTVRTIDTNISVPEEIAQHG